MSGKARNYVFTINFGDAEVTQLLTEEFPPWFSFVIWQLECGDEGTMHYQGYLELRGPQTMARVHAVPGFERAALAVIFFSLSRSRNGRRINLIRRRRNFAN